MCIREEHFSKFVNFCALKFVGEATLEGLSGKKVIKEVFQVGHAMDHINLMKWADIILLCPASANRINALAAGLGKDIVGSLFLAYDFQKPYMIVPAMNTRMYHHPLTMRSKQILSDLGLKVMPTNSGRLACGDQGEGKMLEPKQIPIEIKNLLGHTEETFYENPN